MSINTYLDLFCFLFIKTDIANLSQLMKAIIKKNNNRHLTSKIYWNCNFFFFNAEIAAFCPVGLGCRIH